MPSRYFLGTTRWHGTGWDPDERVPAVGAWLAGRGGAGCPGGQGGAVMESPVGITPGISGQDSERKALHRLTPPHINAVPGHLETGRGASWQPGRASGSELSYVRRPLSAAG